MENICDNCGKLCLENDVHEVRVKDTRTHIFVCTECSEDLEKFILIL